MWENGHEWAYSVSIPPARQCDQWIVSSVLSLPHDCGWNLALMASETVLVLPGLFFFNNALKVAALAARHTETSRAWPLNKSLVHEERKQKRNKTTAVCESCLSVEPIDWRTDFKHCPLWIPTGDGQLWMAGGRTVTKLSYSSRAVETLTFSQQSLWPRISSSGCVSICSPVCKHTYLRPLSILSTLQIHWCMFFFCKIKAVLQCLV